jgi:hypothetical protein
MREAMVQNFGVNSAWLCTCAGQRPVDPRKHRCGKGFCRDAVPRWHRDAAAHGLTLEDVERDLAPRPRARTRGSIVADAAVLYLAGWMAVSR